MMKKIVMFMIAALLLVMSQFSTAEILHVVEGYEPTDPNYDAYSPDVTFPNLQEAWGNSSNGDEIMVHAGVYQKGLVRPASYYTDPNIDPNYQGSLSPFVLNTTVDGNRVRINEETPGFPDIMDRSSIWIHPAGDGKVTFKGGIRIYGTPTGNMDNITIEGFYIDTSEPGTETQINRSGLFISCDTATATVGKEILGLVTMRDCVIYNGTPDVNETYADSGCQFRSGGDHGPYVIEHCTFVNLGPAKGTGNGIYDRKVVHPSGPPVYRSNMVMNFFRGTFTSDFYDEWNYLFDYSNVYSLSGDTEYNYQNVNYFGLNSYSMHPQFVSTDPNDALFLMLGPDSPDELKTGAHDGEPIGARIENMGLGSDFCGLSGYKQADRNHDCYVNLGDFALLARDWLECTHPDCD